MKKIIPLFLALGWLKAIGSPPIDLAGEKGSLQAEIKEKKKKPEEKKPTKKSALKAEAKEKKKKHPKGLLKFFMVILIRLSFVIMVCLGLLLLFIAWKLLLATEELTIEEKQRRARSRDRLKEGFRNFLKRSVEQKEQTEL